MPPTQIRLNKFLAERLGVSRREADALISAGKILVDDKPAVTGAKIDKNSKVCYNKKIIPFEVDFLYLAFNKPVGYVCSRRAQGDAPTLYELLPTKYQNLKTVGRLDKDSSGLILLTNDGDFAYQMTHPKFRKEKIYQVVLDKPLQPLHQQMISDYGVMLADGSSKFVVLRTTEDELDDSRASSLAPVFSSKDQTTSLEISNKFDLSSPRCSVVTGLASSIAPVVANTLESPNSPSYTVILSEGRNRQIRRTFAALGYTVIKLHRTQFGKYQLGGLESGKYDIIKA